ncbi:hypothetical protein [Achromobacter xylosoxidans]|uniref:hypothetical protein n=1 Tax=Alcaligenes xylosoxydans xylosoxydans TaxID=85698 RepID=UPI0029304B2A|nr:hypothetical protein [Achromobacter xylosoxidans]WOB73983.1 hypothetical protein PZA07_00450 [Achromobacter xylosoxidans]
MHAQHQYSAGDSKSGTIINEVKMYHGLTNQFLYSAYKIMATFCDEIGNRKSGTGTCFFVKNKFDEICLITNRHVLDFSFKKRDKSLEESLKFKLYSIEICGKHGSIDDNYPIGDTKFSVIPDVKFSQNQFNDIACIFPLRVLDGGLAKIDYFVPYSFMATRHDFERELMICDFLAFPGFPEWHDKSANRPILRTGTISSDPRFDYSYGDDVKGACLAYEAFSFSGSSGSPVFAVQKGPKPGSGISFPGFRELKLVGINAGHLKVTERAYRDKENVANVHSGISYLYKTSAILDVIDGTPASV